MQAYTIYNMYVNMQMLQSVQMQKVLYTSICI